MNKMNTQKISFLMIVLTIINQARLIYALIRMRIHQSNLNWKTMSNVKSWISIMLTKK